MFSSILLRLLQAFLIITVLVYLFLTLSRRFDLKFIFILTKSGSMKTQTPNYVEEKELQRPLNRMLYLAWPLKNAFTAKRGNYNRTNVSIICRIQKYIWVVLHYKLGFKLTYGRSWNSDRDLYLCFYSLVLSSARGE